MSCGIKAEIKMDPIKRRANNYKSSGPKSSDNNGGRGSNGDAKEANWCHIKAITTCGRTVLIIDGLTIIRAQSGARMTTIGAENILGPLVDRVAIMETK